jgi:secondary thiamine-phosphate synthase enzyme
VKLYNLGRNHAIQRIGKKLLSIKDINVTVQTMPVITRTVTIKTERENDMIDITSQTEDILKASGLQDGIITVFVSGSTAAVTTIEYEPGLSVDFPRMLERVAPKGIQYEHDSKWHDGNGHSHVRAALVGPSLTVPFKDKSLMLGIWQQIVLLEMDTRPRERKIILQVIGE